MSFISTSVIRDILDAFLCDFLGAVSKSWKRNACSALLVVDLEISIASLHQEVSSWHTPLPRPI